MTPFSEADGPWTELLDLALSTSRPAFTRSSRRHRIGRGRMLAILTNGPRLFVNDHRRVDGHFLMAIGADPDGRLLEIGFILTDNGEVVVLHAMDARRRWLRELTEEE